MNSLEIAKSILSRIADEMQAGVTLKAHGVFEFIDPSNSKRIGWLVFGDLRGRLGYVVGPSNIVEDVVQAKIQYLNKDLVISKNTPFGNAIAELNNGVGQIEIQVKGQKSKHQILSSAQYLLKFAETDAYQGRIFTAEDKGLVFEESLKATVRQLENLLQPSTSEEEILTLNQHLERIQEEILQLGRNAHRYRRTTSSIRQQFLLDAEQNRIKREKLFNGPLIIDGGPGTGKTTLLIHRVQYMLDKEVENDERLMIKLTLEEMAYIRDQRTGWIFFTPTTLLKKYLEQAMIVEGLEAHDETVRTWEQQREVLKASLQLFTIGGSKGFLAYRDASHLWNLRSEEIMALTKEFDAFILQYFKTRLEKLKVTTKFASDWKDASISIYSSLSSKSITSLASLIRAINGVVAANLALMQRYQKRYDELITEYVLRIQPRLTSSDKEWFAGLLQKQSDALEPDEELDDLEETFEGESNAGRLDLDINKSIRHAIRNRAIQLMDKSHRLSQRDEQIFQRIGSLLTTDRILPISSSAVFLKYMKPIFRGSDQFILSQLNSTYKAFRKDKLVELEWMPKSVKEKMRAIISQNPRNKRLHDDETDFLIMTALRLARIFRLVTPTILETSTQSILLTYRSVMKGIVAVDEATDFSPVQLYCMYLLSMPRLNSITFCGDLMQQMNNRGMNDWDGVKKMLPDVKKANLLKSYRQTPRLLELATTLYKHRYKQDPMFSTDADAADNPPPLVMISDDKEEKIQWIAHRIAELYQIYERVIPNVALFVKDDSSIKPLSDALSNSDVLYDLGITVKPCIGESDIGSADYVRVFNIRLIKGMEFESVFFVDVDDYPDKEILDKLIYVGVSRATYYLAITLIKDFPAQLMPIKHLLVKDSTWTRTERDY